MPLPSWIDSAAHSRSGTAQIAAITDAAAISWQGSVGAARYTVERAPKADGPWTMAGANIDEASCNIVRCSRRVRAQRQLVLPGPRKK